MVLIKLKLQRNQIPRCHRFRKLLALVFDPEDIEDQSIPKLCLINPLHSLGKICLLYIALQLAGNNKNTCSD